MTTYQRLKAENKSMKQELIELCLNPESVTSNAIRLNYAMIGSLERSVWQGEVKGENKFQGVFHQLTKNEEHIKLSMERISR